MIGSTISHYNIVEKLGEGGMGIVYRAHDTTLDRDVALKFLPSYLASAGTERERFFHEARAAATLNHPNVATVHEISEADNQVFIAMELVEGKTLKQVIAEKPLAIKDVLEITIGICDGLAAAHEKGIVHRDIKSTNIMLTSKRHVKIMDFGLAKLGDATKLTRTGSTVGTAAYMSPEQAQGEDVDGRSDIFSFGVVLYELLTGNLPFRGEHAAALAYSLLNEQPQPMARFNNDVTPELERIVLKALEKEKSERYQHADDIAADLRKERKTLESGSSSSRARAISAQPSKKKLWIGVGGAVVILIAAFALFLTPDKSLELNPDMTTKRVRVPFEEISPPSLSSDGKLIAFRGSNPGVRHNIYLMSLASGDYRVVNSDTAIGYVRSLEISPDGSQIAYWYIKGDSHLAIVSSLGGPSRLLAESAVQPVWRPDGQRLMYARSGLGGFEYHSVRPDGSDDRIEFEDSLTDMWSYSYSPDGESVARRKAFDENVSEVVVRHLKTGKEIQLTHDRKSIAEGVTWAPNNHIIFSSNRGGNYNLWMVSASGGNPVQITRGSGPDIQGWLSEDGRRLLYHQLSYAHFLWIANIDGSGAKQLTFDERAILGPSLSPDGKRIALFQDQTWESITHSTLYLMDRDGSNGRPLTAGLSVLPRWRQHGVDLGLPNSPIWSPNGRFLAYAEVQDPLIHGPFSPQLTKVIEISDPRNIRTIGGGRPIWWTKENEIVVIEEMRTMKYSFDGTQATQVYEDSTWAIPLQNGNIFYCDLREGRTGFWLVPQDAMQERRLRNPRQISKHLGAWRLAKSGEYFIVRTREEGWKKVYMADGKEESIIDFSPRFYGDFSISDDGKVVIYVLGAMMPRNEVYLIENPFR